MFDIYSTYLGDRLGLYTALPAASLTCSELARRTGTDERYVREWLEQQVVIGTLEVDDPSARESEGRFAVLPGYAEVLVHHGSTNYLAPLAQLMIGEAPRANW
jgi:hypothetical protein